MNESYEKVIELIVNAKNNGHRMVSFAIPSGFNYKDFSEYVNKTNKYLVEKIVPSMGNSNEAIAYLFYTEISFLDEIVQKLSYMYAENNQNRFLCPAVPEYLKPYDIKEWYKYISSKINIVTDMKIDKHGFLTIYIEPSAENIRAQAEMKERAKIERAQAEAYERKIGRIINDAIDKGKPFIEFTFIDADRPMLGNVLKVPTYETMALINRISFNHYEPHEVYTFACILSNNDLDKVGERLTDEALNELAEKFVGTCGTINHDKSTINNNICIYRTEVVVIPDRTTFDNKPFKELRGWAFIPRNNINDETIRMIEKGLRKGISIAFSCENKICSICGKDNCQEHKATKIYDGKLCYYTLSEIDDVYEFSCVDNPACKNSCILSGDYSDNTEVVNESEFDTIMRIAYNYFMDSIEGFSYIKDNKSLIINLKQRNDSNE